MWCSRHFEAPEKLGRAGPPSSTPKAIFYRLASDVATGDRHSAKIKSLREGLRRGAALRFASGEITVDQHNEVTGIIDNAELNDFAPRLYVIDMTKVAHRLVIVPAASRANSFSDEFQIECLRSNEFDVLNLAL